MSTATYLKKNIANDVTFINWWVKIMQLIHSNHILGWNLGQKNFGMCIITLI